jgi:glycosyltransferase involved in cell wall biosynthesis
MTARFSIFIPVWNDTHWLPGAIESVLAQDYEDWELIVGDNASTADVEGVVRRFDDPRVRYHCWTTHVRIDENFNRTALLCRNPWVQILAADDRLRPGALSRMADAIEEWSPGRERLAMVVTACLRRFPDGRSADHVWYGSKPKLPVQHGIYDARGWLRLMTNDGYPPWNPGTMAIHRSVIEESGGFFRPEVGLSADVEQALRVAAYGDIGYIDEPLLDFTVRSDSDNAVRLWSNRSTGQRRTPVGTALLAGLAVHEHRRTVAPDERRAVMAAIARSHLQRAAQHRVLADGNGRGGALRDVARAIAASPRTVLTPYHAAYAVAAVIAPRAVLGRAQRWMAGRLHGAEP